MSSEAQPIQIIIKQKDEATFIKISVLMDQITSDLKNQTTTASQPTQDPTSLSSRRCYCPRDDELKTARRLLRSRSKKTSVIRINLYTKTLPVKSYPQIANSASSKKIYIFFYLLATIIIIIQCTLYHHFRYNFLQVITGVPTRPTTLPQHVDLQYKNQEQMMNPHMTYRSWAYNVVHPHHN